MLDARAVTSGPLSELVFDPAPRLWPDPRRPLRIGLLNNMPDAALVQTERQFRRLVEAGAGERPAELVLFGLDGIARTGQARAHAAASYRSHRTLPQAGLDALIVTGCEPRAGRLSDEPYFPALAEVIDWARSGTVSTLFSCLATHAAVLHLDRIERRRLPAKHSGVYACMPLGGHPLTRSSPASVPVPHSRWNDLAEVDLAAAGYAVLRRSDEVGVDLFAKQTETSLFVFLQGHPEYDGDSLAREYRRDVGRFLSGEREDCPALPDHYFPRLAASRLKAFAREAEAGRDPALFARFPGIASVPPLQAAWQDGAAGLFRNWLSLVAERRAMQVPPLPVHA